MRSIIPRRPPAWLTDPLVGALSRMGVTPNMLTLAGAAGNIAAAVLAGYGEFLAAGIVLLVFSGLDFLDGALARATGRATPFGSAFDAIMDRVSEAAVLFGLFVFFIDKGGRTEEVLLFIAVTGSLMVSYARARAEIIGLKLTEGMFTRAERVALLGAGLIIGDVLDEPDVITGVLWVLAVLTPLTALQRLYIIWRDAPRQEATNE